MLQKRAISLCESYQVIMELISSIKTLEGRIQELEDVRVCVVGSEAISDIDNKKISDRISRLETTKGMLFESLSSFDPILNQLGIKVTEL